MNSVIEFGSLEEAALRDAWPHEALNFTPWLASNLGRIGDAVGIPLEHVGSEVPVATFAADILARNPQNDSLVLIENQLEEGDHLHLGQILTYLAGLEAQTVIWVAAKFRDPHLSAIRWLNEHTVEPYAFFALRVRVVRIGTSPFAPIFEVVEGPNNWDRQVHEAARKSVGTTELGAFRQAFWAHYLARHPALPNEHGGGAGSHRWRRLSERSVLVNQYVAKNGVGMFVRGETPAARDFLNVALLPRADELAAELGAPVEGANGYLFQQRLDGDTRDQANWDQMVDWLKEQSDRYTEVLERVLESQARQGEVPS